MRIRSLFSIATVAVALIATASGQRWAEKRNKDFNPEATAAASTFNSFTTGVLVKVKSAAIAKDGTITAQFTLTDSNGAGLDRLGVQTAGAVSLSFVAAYIPQGQTQYTAYTTTVLNSSTNNNPPQTQAGTDTGGTYVLVDASSGTYTYTFGKKAPTTFDATATTTIGVQASRNLAAYGYPTAYTSNTTYSFVPNGSNVTVVRDIVTEKACNNCHNPISAHGGARTEIAYCVLCHTPQSVNPDTLNTVDMKVFIHKLHMGSSLPSVIAGTPYQIYHRGAWVDFSTIVFPQDIRNCTTCHAAGPTQSGYWATQPTRAACGSCHDDVNFATGQNHVNLIQYDDTQCTNCHTSTMHNEFDASVPGAHTIPSKSTSLAGIVTKVISVKNATPGNAPTVQFQVSDKSGNPVDITKLTTFRVVLGGANVDYGVNGIRVSETPTTQAGGSLSGGAGGVYTYTMSNKIPAGATGSYTVSLLAENNVTLLPGTTQQVSAVDWAAPFQYYFSVDSTPVVARRQVVSTANCSKCHDNLAFVHGGSRADTQACVICHNPTLTDGTSKDSVNFAWQIHSIHRGEALSNPYVLGTTNYQEVRFPGDLRYCNTCHVGQSYQVDNVGAVANVASNGAFLPSTPPIAAACQGCHDDKATASHALANTTALGEACVVCHGINGEFAVDTVHARVIPNAN
ncbi:MAG TPA: OmcA/MtrC family decaheme c-type cytochrome [Bryobacteraceae bacterium]|nr:OmcA/MtrC family decaheme c-type cytochrome [Bryobacteraceae bacterium]